MSHAAPLRFALLLTTAAALAPPAAASDQAIKITIDAGERDRQNAPVRAIVQLAGEGARAGAVTLTDQQGNVYPGQLVPLGVLAATDEQGAAASQELHLIVPRLPAGERLTLAGAVRQDQSNSRRAFHWEGLEGKQATLLHGDRPVLRYMHERVDNSSKQRREETYKVYHHLFDPSGERLVTKGPGGLFPHHRGIFYAFNKVTYGDGKKADVWHCNNGESQTHEGTLSESAGPVLGRHLVEIHWNGQDGQPFAKELRQMTAYSLAGGTLLEFHSRLVATSGPVKLDGDPQHAGFQFRASQEVPDRTKDQTYYLRPDGKGEPGKFRNWPMDKDHADLPWNALSFVLGSQRYTCVYLDHPQNPKEARYSERDYGRFGSYFEAEIDVDKPLDVQYRIWLQEGEMTVEEAEALSRSFVDPPKATVVE